MTRLWVSKALFPPMAHRLVWGGPAVCMVVSVSVLVTLADA